jgi:hypothetical protein
MIHLYQELLSLPTPAQKDRIDLSNHHINFPPSFPGVLVQWQNSRTTMPMTGARPPYWFQEYREIMNKDTVHW